MSKEPDVFNRCWPDVSDNERCKTCGQPDNCGDCNHAPLTLGQVGALGGHVDDVCIKAGCCTLRAREYVTEVARLRPALDAVVDKDNWKMPVDATIPADAFSDRDIEDALIYYTGSIAEIYDLGDGTKRVLASGYYANIGS